MIRKLILTLILCIAPLTARSDSIVGALPYNLTNGTTADASQVMANFNTIVTGTNTNAAANGINSSITQLTGLTTPLSRPQGGTGNANGFISLGTTSSVTNPAITGDATSGLYSAGSAKVDISISGTKICEVTSAAETCSAFVPTASSTSNGLALPSSSKPGIFASGQLSQEFVSVGTAVNYLETESEPTGTGPVLAATGSDSTVALQLATLGTNSALSTQMVIGNTTSAVDYLQATGSVTGNPGTVTLSAQGSDSNVNLNLVSKGTGKVEVNGAAAIASVSIQKFTSAGTPTYTPHAGNVYDIVECVGAGGGAGGGSSSSGSSGGGGSGGYARVVVSTPGSQTVTVGAGGAGGDSSGDSGATGGTSSFGSLCVATGGVGSATNSSGYSLGGAAGSGSTGTFLSTGNPGSLSLGTSYSGTGGGSFFGGAGQGIVTTGNGNSGTACGGGGGGAFSGGNTAGGSGHDGCVIVTEFNNQ